MKKYLFLLLKFIVTLFPLRLRQHFKKNLHLTAFYSRSLRQVGIIQNIPNVQSECVAYQKNRKSQAVYFDQLSTPVTLPPVLLVLVIEANQQQLARTLASVKNLKIGRNKQSVFFYCAGEKQSTCRKILKKLNFDVSADHIISEKDSGMILSEAIIGPCFIIFEGDTLHGDYAKVLHHKLLEETEIAYVDVDFLRDDNERHLPEFYPDWNPDLQLSTSYIQSGVWIKNVQFLLANGGLSLSFTYLSERLIFLYLNTPSIAVQHIPYVLLHRTKRFSLCHHKANALLSSKAIVNLKQDTEICSLSWPITVPPLVSIVIPTKNGRALVKACIESIFELTTYQNFEILLVDNNSDEAESLAYFDALSSHPQISVLKYSHEFNYSAINNFAVQYAKGEVIALVNNDIEVIEPSWLSYMVGHVMRDDIGCVGAKLLYPNNLIQHAGVVMGYGGGAGHAHKYFPADHPGYLNRISATNNFSAVTAACLLVKKRDYEQVGGLNEVEFKVAFNDVDFCLRILGLGRRNLYCAEAVLYHHESVSRGHEDTVEKLARFNSEVVYMQSLWHNFIQDDPAYNPNLTLRYENFAIKE